jgi:hypothetical protein
MYKVAPAAEASLEIAPVGPSPLVYGDDQRIRIDAVRAVQMNFTMMPTPTK